MCCWDWGGEGGGDEGAGGGEGGGGGGGVDVCVSLVGGSRWGGMGEGGGREGGGTYKGGIQRLLLLLGTLCLWLCRFGASWVYEVSWIAWGLRVCGRGVWRVRLRW